MKDLIITIPGIMGSTLTHEGKDLWNPGLGLVTKLLTHRRWVEQLALPAGDDPTKPFAPDGAQPTAPISSHTIVPGLVEIDGYTELDGAIRRAFPTIVEGDPLRPTHRTDGRDPRQHGVPNYYQFAYDWRRDVRSAAMRLADLIDTALAALREQRSPRAKVILVGHSLGGLVARYYLYGTDLRTDRPFDGWRNTREVLTFGTPYRGAPSALGYLLTGYKMLFVNFTTAVRSFPSMYQLLPRFRVAQGVGGSGWVYPHEIPERVGFDPAKALAAYHDFHLVMDKGLAAADASAQRITVPHVGFGHATHGSVRLNGPDVEVESSAPSYVDAAYGDGDGTVPLLSAIPLELDGDRSALRYTNQKHASIQSDRRTLEPEILQRLRQAQLGTANARDAGSFGALPTEPSLGVNGPSVFLDGEQPFVDLAARGVASDVKLSVTIRDLASAAVVKRFTAPMNARTPLPVGPGEYRVDVTARAPRLASSALICVVDAAHAAENPVV